MDTSQDESSRSPINRSYGSSEGDGIKALGRELRARALGGVHDALNSISRTRAGSGSLRLFGRRDADGSGVVGGEVSSRITENLSAFATGELRLLEDFTASAGIKVTW